MYRGYAPLVIILTIASSIDTGQWPANAVLLGWEATGRLLGLTGVALGTLIPTSIECIGFVLLNELRVIGVRATEALKEIFLPAFLPAAPMAIMLWLAQKILEPSSLPSIMVVSGISMLVYAIGYLRVDACAAEREPCLSFALGTIRYAEACFKRT